MLDPAKIGRLGELDAPPARSSRVRRIDGRWYFATREGKLAGPFATRADSHKAADDFVHFAMIYSDNVLNRLLSYLSQAGEEEHQEVRTKPHLIA